MADTADYVQQMDETATNTTENPTPTPPRPGSIVPPRSSIALDEAFNFVDIGYKLPDGSKMLLSGVTGSVAPGTMMAVMGPSGAGKSTFLDVLSMRRQKGGCGKSEAARFLMFSLATTLENLVFLGNQEITTAQQMGVVGSYVEQRDDLLGVLTVRESIMYAAKLRMPRESAESRRERVEHIISSLGLTKCANQIIGNPLQKGISGGQKRRVTIGMSLVTYPKVLFLDEPTSGLDATTSREVMAAIKRIAIEKRMIVIATIHQPNFETLSLFSSVLILAEGKVMYKGALEEMDHFFAEYGKPIPRFVNPADHAIDLVNTDFDGPLLITEGKSSRDKASGDGMTVTVETDGGALARTDALARFQMTYADRRGYDRRLREFVAEGRTIPLDAGNGGGTLDGISTFMRHTAILCERTSLNYTRNLLAYGVRVGMYLGMGIMMATIWVRLGNKDSTINDRLSVHFFSVAFLSFMSVAGIPAFLEERSVFIREKHNGLYKAGPYALANSLVNIPFLFLCALLFSCISYYAIGLNGSAVAFFRFLTFLFLAIYAAESQTVLISALLPIFIAALAIGAFMNGFWMCVQGYFIRAISLPRFWYYSFHWMDYQTYAFELLANSDLRGVDFTCGVGPSGKCQCAYPSSLGPDSCTVSGDDVLKYLDINWIGYGNWTAILISIAIIYRILFYVVLARSK
ncbi:hypothetical protein HDU96_010407 [Phlyctochytrium bullatum]|nr:hypothetical protein HDU96_010407 [Phlyctochytrium bullatum]